MGSALQSLGIFAASRLRMAEMGVSSDLTCVLDGFAPQPPGQPVLQHPPTGAQSELRAAWTLFDALERMRGPVGRQSSFRPRGQSVPVPKRWMSLKQGSWLR